MIGEASSDSEVEIGRLRAGAPGALALLFDRYRPRLLRMVEMRLDTRLRARLEASDILQDAYLDLNHDLAAYLAGPEIRPFLWMRMHVGRRLAISHRRHLGTRMRAAGLEIARVHRVTPEASSAGLALMLLGRNTSPSRAVQRAEQLARVQEALDGLDPIDREILALRHFEQLTRGEVASLLEIDPTTGAKRYFRALKRLKAILESLPGGLESL